MSLSRKISKQKHSKADNKSRTILSCAYKDVYERYFNNIEKTCVVIANIMTVYLLAKDMKMSKPKCLEYLKHYIWKMDAIEAHNQNAECGTTFDDIIRYEIIAGKEFDKGSLGWSDYKGMETEPKEYLLAMPEAKNHRELYYNTMRGLALELSEKIFNKHEAAVISALHDFCGYGLKRIKTFVEKKRALTWSTPEEFEIILEWMSKRFIITEIEKIRKLKFFWPLCLKPRI